LSIAICRKEVKHRKDKQKNKQEICSKIVIKSILDKILLQDLQRILNTLKLLYYLNMYRLVLTLSYKKSFFTQALFL